jgi:hypothetical protein
MLPADDEGMTDRKIASIEDWKRHGGGRRMQLNLLLCHVVPLKFEGHKFE